MGRFIILFLFMLSWAGAALSLEWTDNGYGNYTVDILGSYSTPFSGDNWCLIVDTNLAKISGGTPVSIPNLSNAIIGSSIEASVLPNPAETDGPFGATLWTDFENPLAETVIYESFQVTIYEGAPEVMLYSGFAEGETIGELVETIRFVLVPEPSTLGIVGLSALVIRCRKRC